MKMSNILNVYALHTNESHGNIFKVVLIYIGRPRSRNTKHLSNEVLNPHKTNILHIYMEDERMRQMVN